MKTKKILIGLVAVATIIVASAVTQAYSVGKPASNLAGAQKVAWNLSGSVMPVPPYGSLDITGSDTASKLIVNQPNGQVQAAITGVMNGLNPNTTYTVYLSNGYTKSLNIVGTWKWLVLGTYEHDMTITTQNPNGTFSGTGGYPAGSSPYNLPGQTTETITGQVIGNSVTFTTTYNGPYNPGYSATVSGTIAPDGTMSGISPWEWHTTAGKAKLIGSGWPGMFGSLVPFTFTTDSTGSASWHVNLRAADFPGIGTYSLSVWINEAGATVLISDPFTVTK